MWSMTNVAFHNPALTQAPKLRLLPKSGRSARRGDCAPGPALRVLRGPGSDEKPVLLAGGDAPTRAAVRDDMARTMTPGTTFEQAAAIWEVLVRAADCRMIVLSGELEGMPAESVMQMLAHRHPSIPVVSVDAVSAGVDAVAACA
jgi:hypothetical protein